MIFEVIRVFNLKCKYSSVGDRNNCFFIRAQTWNFVTINLKYSKSFNEFKENTQKWSTKECPCHLLK